jgi:hypothetical protein
MAKDRFSNQKKSNYNKEFRYGITSYSSKQKCNIVLYPTDKKYIKEILDNSRLYLNSWEKDFLVSLESRALISEKQKFHLDEIFRKLKEKRNLFVRG